VIEGTIRAIYSPSVPRKTHDSQFTLGQVPIADIQFDPKNRNDIPAVLMGLQVLWCDENVLAGSLRFSRSVGGLRFVLLNEKRKLSVHGTLHFQGGSFL